MPRAVEQALGDLRQTFDTVAQQAVTGLPPIPLSVSRTTGSGPNAMTPWRSHPE